VATTTMRCFASVWMPPLEAPRTCKSVASDTPAAAPLFLESVGIEIALIWRSCSCPSRSGWRVSPRLC
jgi:hypothetical protein